MADLKTNLLGFVMNSPVIGASGTVGYGVEYEELADFSKIGGISGKGLTLHGQYGNKGERLWETPSGLINSIGLQNPGVQHFIDVELPEMLELKQKYGTVAIANLGGHSEEEYVEGAAMLSDSAVDIVELNISCPNVKVGGMAYGVKAEAAGEVVRMVRAACKKPLMVKLSPLYAIYPVTGFMVTSVGAITFLLAALMAISQSNAKRVLAYSTISNLGLISACLGVGAPEAVWAAIFLILFHTVAKSLLFLCVGTAEHHIGSRNIEDMDGMFSRMPHLTRLMMLGIMGMFVAPFGMLVSKWGALVAFAQTGNVLMIMVLAFGSAATFFFWGKWLAKLSGVDPTAQNVEVNVHKTEWMALNTIAALLILCCVAFPVISSGLVSPYLAMVFGRVPYVIGKDAMYLMVVIVAFIAVVLLTSFRVSNKPHVNVYLSGVGTDKYRHFRGSMGHEVKAEKRNWYSEDALGEKRIGPAGSVVCCSIILFALLCCAWIGPERLAMSAPSVLRGKYFEGSGVVGIFIGTVAFALLAPLVGGLIDGLDRKLSARMQGRVGPRLLQPFYDVAKLLRKAPASVNTMDDTYMACALIFTVVGGGIFVSGSNTLLCAFMVTLAAIFVVLASASTQSPFAQVGADRELLQVMSYEPAVLLMSVGLYLATDSFDSIAVPGPSAPIIVYSAPIFLALLAVLTIKLRKSPFDLSYSHHAHQEIVQGVATEMSGGTLAKMTLMHWCETVLFLMWVGMFFVWDNPVSWVVALVVMAATYFVEVLIDNTFARSTWRSCFKLGWGVALVFGLLNLMPILVDVFI